VPPGAPGLSYKADAAPRISDNPGEYAGDRDDDNVSFSSLVDENKGLPCETRK
jgi:hypothetical protein